MNRATILLSLTIFLIPFLPLDAQLPESGLYVPELDAFDNVMQDVMAEFDIESGVLAVNNNGVVIYQRGFGVDVPENTPMRLASVSKPITAAAIRQLILDGQLDFDDRVFDLGTGQGILTHTPWQGNLGDNRLQNVTVRHLMDHVGGWDPAVPLGDPPLGNPNGGSQQGDPQFLTVEIAQRMGVPVPANRDNIIEFMLAQPLQYDPGDVTMGGGCIDPESGTYCYSNFGYMVLGRIVEEVSGLPLVDYFRNQVITPGMWVPHQELLFGRTLLVNQDPREPIYVCPGCSCTNVFDPAGPQVPCPYGGFQLEAFQGHGNLVASAVPLLRYMDNYVVGVQSNAGAPWTFGVGGQFNGAFDGTNTTILQRGDGINIAVLFAKKNGSSSAAQMISNVITNNSPVFPTFAVDGYWVDFTAAPGPIEVGGFHHEFRTMQQALNVGAGANLRLKPGASSWTGTISHNVTMDAPFGTAIIGN